jgi:exopolysaccharide biosynthesis protein
MKNSLKNRDFLKTVCTPILAAVMVCSFLFTPAFAKSNEFDWEEIYKGVDYLVYEVFVGEKPVKVFVVSVDSRQKGISIVVSPYQYRMSTTSEFAKKMNAQIAINGGFFSRGRSSGLVVYEGNKWPVDGRGNQTGFFAVTKNGKPWISDKNDLDSFSSDEVFMAIASRPMLVKDGKIVISEDFFHGIMRGPRTAVGIDQTGRKLLLFVCDGRHKESIGLKMQALADIMIKFGVWNGINLDGGGSSTLYIENKAGVVNKPSDGKERTVANCIGVIIKKQ